MPGCTVCATFSGTAQELWEATHGTESYGNLPQYKKDQHVGKVYYMQPSRHSSWGYECTFDNCPHFVATGKHYFYK